MNLRASWHDAPMGQASRLLSGEDMGWRGQLNLDATFAGQLRAAKVTLAAHVNDLRRADFVPATMLDFAVLCEGAANVPTAVVDQPQCKLDTGHSQYVVAVADSLDLTSLQPAGLRVGAAGVDVAWFMEWARLFSPRIPPSPVPTGTVSGSVVLASTVPGAPPQWNGEIRGGVQGRLPLAPAQLQTEGGPQLHAFAASIHGQGIMLAPFPLADDGQPPLLLSASADLHGATLHLAGTATGDTLRDLTSLVPPAGDGVEAALPELAATPGVPIKIDLTCTRTWGGPQTCTPAPKPAATPPSRPRHHSRR